MAQKFANAARAYLASTISDSATTVTIVSGGALFPEIASPDFARAVLQDANGIEIVLITAHTASADSFTVTRAQEGTTARSFAAGSVFGIRVTAADMDEALDAVNLATEVTGTLPIANGGTGQTTRQAAMDALAGAVTAGQYLRGDGTDVVMSAIQAADVPTLNQNTTGQAGSVANALTAGTYLTSAGTYNGSAARTFAVDATSANTADKVVARDASGNFSAGTITAALNGNAATATTASSANALSGINSNISSAAQAGTISSVIAQDTNASLYRYTAQAVATFISGQSMNITGAASANLALAGGTMTGQLTTRETTGTTPIVNGGGSNSLQVMGNPSNGAFMSFHRAGAYAINMGLDTSNVLSCGGWSDGGNYRWQIDTSGNFTARGNVTAYSDERLKKDWADLPADFIEQLSKVKHGTYTRIDSGERQAGVSAQGLQAVLSESVMKDGQGNLSVAYGNAALTAAVELAARVIALEARLAALEV